MADIITQQSILRGEVHTPVPGETRYAVAPGVVGVLNEATEDLIEAFERAEMEATEAAAPHQKVIWSENTKAMKALQALRAPAGAEEAEPGDSAATVRASFEISRIAGRSYQAKAEAALTLQGGAKWETLRGKCNRRVIEAAAADFFSTYSGSTSGPLPSSETSSPESAGPESRVAAPSQP